MAAADKCQPTIIGMSALLTTTMTYMKTVIDGFEAAGRGHIKMAVGGAPISQMFADEIGADGYGQNASAAVDLFLRLAQEADAATSQRGVRLMATYKVLYWQEVPSQIKAEDDADDVTLQMPDRFQERIDAWPPSAAWAARTTTWPSGAGARTRSATARRRTSPRPCAPSSRRRPACSVREPPACDAATA